MKSNHGRIELIKKSLCEAGLDALVCTLPANVLMLTGYFPVVGTSIGIVTREGRALIIAPEDEKELAETGWADDILSFKPGWLSKIIEIQEAVRPQVLAALKELNVEKRKIGVETGAWFEPVSYASMHLYGASLTDFIASSTGALVASADDVIERLRAVKTKFEIERIRRACLIAGQAFHVGRNNLRAGLREREAAAAFRAPLAILEEIGEEVERAEGDVFCMSGENTLKANAAYQRSREKLLKKGEFVLVHCNSHADGYWTDITRTYFLGEPKDEQLRKYEAVFAALEAALAEIRPGVLAWKVDKAARDVLVERGFGRYFKHGTGHEVGFAAINHNAFPRIHPASGDVLEAGMTFNVEPAIYLEPAYGMRHCEMVVVTETGSELLTPFQRNLEDLIIRENS